MLNIFPLRTTKKRLVDYIDYVDYAAYVDYIDYAFLDRLERFVAVVNCRRSQLQYLLHRVQLKTPAGALIPASWLRVGYALLRSILMYFEVDLR